MRLEIRENQSSLESSNLNFEKPLKFIESEIRPQRFYLKFSHFQRDITL